MGPWFSTYPLHTQCRLTQSCRLLPGHRPWCRFFGALAGGISLPSLSYLGVAGGLIQAAC